jgi:WD40 repeat protein
VTSIDWSPDGSRLASVSFESLWMNRGMKLWDVATREELLSLRQPFGIAFEYFATVSWSADGHRLSVTGRRSNDGVILVMDGTPPGAIRAPSGKGLKK